MSLETEDLKQLQHAKILLENPGIAAKLTDFIGTPIEGAFKLLPKGWNSKISDIVQTSLTKAADAALFTMKDCADEESSNWWHKLAAATSGGVGGFFGLAGVGVELPISTTIMLRSIADIARSEGENLKSDDTKKACIEVFALGGKSKSDDASESGYFAVRTLLARSVAEASEFLLEKTIAEEGAPALVRLIATVSTRFGIQVSEKVAAQAVPVIGAAGGAAINLMFIDHFQDMGRGHFIVRRLERKYGAECIKATYESLHDYCPKNSQG